MARIFAALWPPDDVVLHLDEYVDAVRSARTDLRWVPAAHWHLTLEFLGSAGPGRSTDCSTGGPSAPDGSAR